MSRGVWLSILAGGVTGWIVPGVAQDFGLSFWWALATGYVAAGVVMLVSALLYDLIAAKGSVPPPRRGN